MALASAEAELGPGFLLYGPVVFVLAWTGNAGVALRHRSRQLDAHGVTCVRSVRQALMWVVRSAARDVEATDFVDLLADGELSLLAEGHRLHRVYSGGRDLLGLPILEELAAVAAELEIGCGLPYDLWIVL